MTLELFQISFRNPNIPSLPIINTNSPTNLIQPLYRLYFQKGKVSIPQDKNLRQ
jgi:hypothetical protein